MKALTVLKSFCTNKLSFSSEKELINDHSHVKTLHSGVIRGETPVYVHTRTQLTFSYLDFIKKEFGENLHFGLDHCGEQLLKFVCEDCGFVELIRKGCKIRNLCPVCARNYTHLKVNHAWDSVFSKFAMSKKYYLMHLVFTVPKEFRDLIFEDSSRFFHVIYKTLKRYMGKDELVGGVASLHLFGSSDFEVKPHIHVLIPNVNFSKKKGDLGFFKRKRPYFNVSQLRFNYMIEFHDEFGGGLKRKNVYVNYVKMRDMDRVLHRLRYTFRKPIENVYPMIEGANGNLSLSEWENISRVLSFNGKRIRWFGFLADGVKSKYLALGGISYERFSDWLVREESKEKNCPECGGVMVYVGKTYEFLEEGLFIIDT